MVLTCSECGATHYPDNTKHLIEGDCIAGFDADTGDPIVLCFLCYPSKWEMVRDGSGLNKFRRV
jgi:hypothetical protein